jgi:ribosomal protein S12 methylthiotransferase accessory factor
LLEAISHGICEVVERDATTLWWARRASDQGSPRLALDTVEDPICRQLLAKFEAADVDVVVWPCTSDVGIASFICVIADRHENPMRPLYTAMGTGCHPSRDIALLRALTEAAQARLTMISGARDDMSPSEYRISRHVDVLASQRAAMTKATDRVSLEDVPTYEAETFDEDVTWELDRLQGAGISQVIAVDLTKPELQIPVVRIVVPGLEGPTEKAAGYTPGPRALAVLAGAT